ncbi:MAG: hypothetical protein QI197_05450 [Candidatus Korarchaeota archaeon]|nr:hypothetical protein [Candidatus Korarchaeota archaeon]
MTHRGNREEIDDAFYISAYIVREFSDNEAEPLKPVSSILAERLGENWNVLTKDQNEETAFSFGLGVTLSSEPINGWIINLKFLNNGEVKIGTLGKSVKIKWEGDRETLLTASKLAALALYLYRNPLMCLREDLIVAGIFYLNPRVWSDPAISGIELAAAFSAISEGLELERRYESFVKALHFLSQLDHLPEMVRALKALAVMGIAPPLSKRDLFYVDQLSPVEIKVLNALTAKEAIDRLYGLDEKKVVILLSELLGLRSKIFDRRKLVKSLLQRESKEGLTLSEISHVLGIDKAYLWRDVLPKMIERFLITVGSDRYRGKTVKVYRPNVSLPTVGDMVLTYTLNLSYLVSRG